MLEETGIFEGTPLPLAIGAARLEAVALPRVALIAPFKGQMMAVADALNAEIGLILPPAGTWGRSKHAQAFWRGRGQWLVMSDTPLAGALNGAALVADMSDAYGRCRLTGANAAQVLARLVAVDIETLPEGAVALTALSDIPVTLIALQDGYEIMLPRSFAGSVVARLEVAMASVAAREMVG